MLHSSRLLYIVVSSAVSLASLGCSKTSSEPEKNPSPAAAEQLKAHEAPKKTVADVPHGQSFKEGMQLICDSINRAGVGLEPAEQRTAVAAWIDKKVTNSQVRELFEIMGNAPPKQRSGMMQAAATKAGLASCAIADQ